MRCWCPYQEQNGSDELHGPSVGRYWEAKRKARERSANPNTNFAKNLTKFLVRREIGTDASVQSISILIRQIVSCTSPGTPYLRDRPPTWPRACWVGKSRMGVQAAFDFGSDFEANQIPRARLCVDCVTPVQTGAPCQKCSGKRTRYTRLILHDLRRTAARNLRRAGISETVIMKIGGLRTGAFSSVT